MEVEWDRIENNTDKVRVIGVEVEVRAGAMKAIAGAVSGKGTDKIVYKRKGGESWNGIPIGTYEEWERRAREDADSRSKQEQGWIRV